MSKSDLKGLDIYIRNVFKILLVLVPIAALLAGVTFTVIKIMGYYPNVSITALIIFDCTCVFYSIVGFSLAHNCQDKYGDLKPRIVFGGKAFIAFAEIVQWNFISYMIPSRDFWAYSIFFILLVVFFLDNKFVLIVMGEIVISMIVSWIVRGDVLLPPGGDLFVPEIILRCVCIVVSLTCLWLITYLVETRMVNVLEGLAEFDSLTGLYNRRNMKRKIDECIYEYNGSGIDFSLLMCDLDDFKKVNDTLGHECGDKILKNTSNIILKEIENRGFAFRFGGEEILVVVHGDKKVALEIAEKIRSRVENETITCSGNKVSITVTIGAVCFDGKTNMEDLIKNADVNLYYGKNHGKNKVVI